MRCGACWTWARRTTTPRSTPTSLRCPLGRSTARACLLEPLHPGLRARACLGCWIVQKLVCTMMRTVLAACLRMLHMHAPLIRSDRVQMCMYSVLPVC